MDRVPVSFDISDLMEAWEFGLMIGRGSDFHLSGTMNLFFQLNSCLPQSYLLHLTLRGYNEQYPHIVLSKV